MIKKMYAWSGLILFKVSLPFVRFYFNARPSRRVRVVVVGPNREVLLIKGWFSHQKWEMPGGGINRGELPVAAAARELYEETGIKASESQFRLVKEFKHTDTMTPYIVILYEVKVTEMLSRTPKTHRWEILEQKWFTPEKLPRNTNNIVSRSLDYCKGVDK